jgi:hypothetical protein
VHIHTISIFSTAPVLQSDAFYEIYDSRICDAEGRGSRALIGRHRRMRRVEFSMGSLADDALVHATCGKNLRRNAFNREGLPAALMGNPL